MTKLKRTPDIRHVTSNDLLYADLPTEQTYDDFRSNRDKARKPRLALVWCPWCDRNTVALGEKCSVCKRREGSKRNKRDAV